MPAAPRAAGAGRRTAEIRSAAVTQTPPAPPEYTVGERFARLQERLGVLYERVLLDPLADRTMVVVPSLTFDPEVLSRIQGVQHYEERMLCLLMLLRLPRARVILVTSQPIHPSIIAYYLHLLPGIPGTHARRRLTQLACYDGSSLPLAQKILDRPRLLARLRRAAGDPGTAYLNCFTVTPLERDLALALDMPIYGCDPALGHLGTKSGSRQLLRGAGLAVPDGVENLRDETDLAGALAALKQRHPHLERSVVKLDGGTSGEGNALFSYRDAPDDAGLERWIADELPCRLRFEASGECWETFRAKLRQMGGITEVWIEAQGKRTPSVQMLIDPLGQVELVSTHEQVMGGPSGQIFLGSTFPADAAYRLSIQELALRAAEQLQRRAVIGRFGVDFVSVPRDGGWSHYALEINLRKGGTTHSFMMLQFLTDGSYDTASGLYRTPSGQPRYYYATDNLHQPAYRGLTPDDLIDIAVEHGLHFHGASQQGVVFHLMGALSEFGKLGTVCVGDSLDKALRLYRGLVEVLDHETGDEPRPERPELPLDRDLSDFAVG